MSDQMNILLVEDNDLDVEMLQRGLKKSGGSGALVRARDGIEALEVLETDAASRNIPRPYVVLLDINMPRMNGHEFLDAIRSDDRFHDLRVFVFTTSSNATDVMAAYARNVGGYIVKPNGTADLVAVLDALREYWSVCENPV